MLLSGARSSTCALIGLSRTHTDPCKPVSTPFRKHRSHQPAVKRSRRCQASTKQDLDIDKPEDEVDIENPDSEMAQKQAEQDRLRKAEKFMKIGTGQAECMACGYSYDPKKGDSEYPVSPGTKFENLPNDWQCPICGAEARTFQSKARTIAGFAENQGYGLGGNSLTSGQKSALIYGSLLLFFSFFILGYFLQ
ncbi:hypothetical protein ABBQ32_009745 [Trebouxia sp. C0010 RCD-2024]